MALDDNQKAERRAMLADSLVPERYVNFPLSKMGAGGSILREYVKGEYVGDAQEGRGAIIINRSTGLAASFARDVVIAGGSINFYYLQTFANKFTSIEAIPQAFVLEWFEQENEPSPFSGSERYRLETAIAQQIDDGVLFYVFTSVHPDASKWWSRTFMQLLQDNCRVIEVKNNAAKRDNKRTTVVHSEEQGQEKLKASKRVGIR